MDNNVFTEWQQIICSSVVVNQQVLPSIDKKNSCLDKINSQIRSNPLPILYRYIPFSANALDNLITESVYLVSADQMNDVFEGAVFDAGCSKEITTSRNRKMQSEVYLKCFSLTNDNILMWSHYADANKGMCIGYDFNQADSRVKKHLFPVQYSDTRFQSNDLQALKAHPFFYLRKSSEWGYEQECRLIYQKKDLPKGNQLLPLNCISEIQFGLRMPESLKKVVQAVVAEKNCQPSKQITLYETIQEKNQFASTRRQYGTFDR